ncbi:MAG: hypothetical protein ACK5X3_10295 [Pseudomonadota bacterium]
MEGHHFPFDEAAQLVAQQFMLSGENLPVLQAVRCAIHGVFSLFF